jgi:hypothetical protein
VIEVIEPPMLIFVIQRLLREMKKCLDVTVAWSTHTRYAPLEDEDELSFEPITHPKTKAAIVPAIGIVGPDVVRNQNSYTAHRREIPTSVLLDGKKVDGIELRNPSWIVDMGFEVQLFHNRKMSLFVLAEKFRQYFVQNPYLVIPADRSDVNGDTIPDHQQFIDDFWSPNPPDQSREGTVIFQRIPHDAPILTSTTRSNDDNLFVTESSVLLQLIPLADESIVAERPDIQEITIDFFEMADETETPQLSFTVPDEE